MNENEALDQFNLENENFGTALEDAEKSEESVAQDIFEEESPLEESTADIMDESESFEENVEELDFKAQDEEVAAEEEVLEEIEDENNPLEIPQTIEEEEFEEAKEENTFVEEAVDSVDDSIDEIDEPDTIADENNQEEETFIDDSIITNDVHGIHIEFGIEAKGFILSVKMMEAMIEKGYIFKDMLDNKIFDAIMIFNGNLENTIVTDDIKIKIDNGKILLIKG